MTWSDPEICQILSVLLQKNTLIRKKTKTKMACHYISWTQTGKGKNTVEQCSDWGVKTNFLECMPTLPPKIYMNPIRHAHLFPFVLVDPDFLHSDWLTGVVHETMHHAFGPWSIMDPSSELQMSGALDSLRSLVAHAVRQGVAEAMRNTYIWGN